MKTILKLLRSYYARLFVMLSLALLTNTLSLVLPKVMGKVIDALGDPAIVLEKVLWQFSGMMLLVFVVGYMQSIFQIYLSEQVSRDLRQKLTDKIAQQSFSLVTENNPSVLLTNLTSDVDGVKAFVAQAIVAIISAFAVLLGSAIVLIQMNAELALMVILITSTIGITFYVVLKKVKVLYQKSREVTDWLNKVITENILGAFLIRVINTQQLEYEKFVVASTDAKDVGFSILRLFAWLSPIIVLTSSLAGLVILLVGGHQVIGNGMSLGDFTAFNSYLTMLVFPVMVIGLMSNTIAQAGVSYGRIRKVLEMDDVLDAGLVDIGLTGALEVKDVSMAYGTKQVLKNVSFSVKPGTRVAIVGPTVAGKSQLLYLLAGMLQPLTGAVRYDGYAIADFASDCFYRQVGFVFQDSVMFNLSIRENIAFNADVTDELLQKAIDTAELQDLIASLPEGLDTLVSERGLSLSGGQKQRIMLARALAINPRVLLLDDFTARVDLQTEQRIMDNIRCNYPSVTLVSVTQKIAAAEQFDKVVLMMQGEVLDAGTHQELMLRSMEYVQIYDSQLSMSNYEL